MVKVLIFLWLISMSFVNVACQSGVHDKKVFKTSSPDGVYDVILVRYNSFVGGESLFRFDVKKGGKPWLSRKYLIGYDSEMEFSDVYQSRGWISNRILAFKAKTSAGEGRESEIIRVQNKSGKKLSYLRVRSWDIALIFDLENDESVDIEVPYYYGGLSWVEAQGEFDDASIAPIEGVNFRSPSRVAGRPAYCVTVEPIQIKIRSTTVDGWNSREKSIPVVKGCNDRL